jgi:mRNA interferase RelE/StbE
MKKREYNRIYQKIKSHIYPCLRTNPHFGRNVKRLKGDFKNIYRYRIGDYKIFYIIDEDDNRVFTLDFHHRKDAYK